MFAKFEHLPTKRLELESRLSDPALMSRQDEYQKIAREHAHVVKMDDLYQDFLRAGEELVDSKRC